MPGLALTAHCEPAREVGGDYYDFLPIDEHRLGMLIADVSGKGTSAALYMAELKGIMLSLSQLHTLAARAADRRRTASSRGISTAGASSPSPTPSSISRRGR